MAIVPYVTPVVVGAMLMLALAAVALTRRRAPGNTELARLLLAIFTWAVGYAFELALPGLETRVFWAKVQYFGIPVLGPILLTFSLSYTGYQLGGRRRWLGLLFVLPLITLVLTWTNEYHHLIWASTVEMQYGEISVVDFNAGPFYWVNVAQSYITLLGATYVLARAMIREPGLYRGQGVLLIAACVAPWLGNVLYMTNLSPLPGLDMTLFGFLLTGLLGSVAVLRFRFLDIVPAARASMFESLPDPVLIFDGALRIVALNPAAARMLGIAVKDAIGQPADELLATRPQVLAALRGGAAGSQRLLDGERHYESRVEAIRDPNGIQAATLLFLRDVTEVARSEEAIRKQNLDLMKLNEALDLARMEAEGANHLKSQFLATMSHELRTPLNAINGYLEITLERMTGDLNPQQERNLKRALQSGEHLLTLVNEILDISRIESGHLQLESDIFILKDIFTRVEAFALPQAQARNLRFETEIDPALPATLMGDSDRLVQVTLNLVGNAIKFTKEGGVKLEARRSGPDHWMIRVTDTGIGIPAEAMAYIFDEFRQVDGGVARHYGGTGLGLAIVRRLVGLMNGSVGVQSAPGQGSSFTVRLPLRKAPARASDSVSAEATPQ